MELGLVVFATGLCFGPYRAPPSSHGDVIDEATLRILRDAHFVGSLQSPASVAFASRSASSRLRGYVEPSDAGLYTFGVDAAPGSLAMEPPASFRAG